MNKYYICNKDINNNYIPIGNIEFNNLLDNNTYEINNKSNIFNNENLNNNLNKETFAGNNSNNYTDNLSISELVSKLNLESITKNREIPYENFTNYKLEDVQQEESTILLKDIINKSTNDGV